MFPFLGNCNGRGCTHDRIILNSARNAKFSYTADALHAHCHSIAAQVDPTFIISLRLTESYYVGIKLR